MARAKQQNYKSPTGRIQERHRAGRKSEKIASSSSLVKLKKAPNERLWSKAMRRIRDSLKSAGRLIPQRSFQQLVEALLQIPEEKLRLELPAYLALQEVAEAELVELCEDWQLCALHAKRVSVASSDIHLVRCLRGQKT